MGSIKLGSHPSRPIDVHHLTAKQEAALGETVGEGTPGAFTDPHVIKVSGVDGCHFWGIATAPRPIADGSNIYPVLQDLGFAKVFYTAAARDKIIALFT